MTEPRLAPIDPSTAPDDLAAFLTDPSGRELCLRPELTIPVCRMHVEQGGHFPARLSYNGLVFRHQPAEPDRPTQFYQAGAELLGAGLGLVDDGLAQRPSRPRRRDVDLRAAGRRRGVRRRPPWRRSATGCGTAHSSVLALLGITLVPAGFGLAAEPPLVSFWDKS